MKSSKVSRLLIRTRRSAWILGLAAFTACTAESGKVPVSLHGVNYTKEEFNYWVQDPLDPKNKGGGEMVDSFSGGGTMCCYELPRQWRPGMQVQIEVKRTLPRKATADNPSEWQDIVDRHTVEIPPYVDGKPGELWVVRHADGSFGVVSSDYQPDHEKWPGSVKGWPVPSLEYQRERWDLYIKIEEGDIRSFKSAVAELESSPSKMAKEEWDLMQADVAKYADGLTAQAPRARSDRALLSGFSGPHDPRFVSWLITKYERAAERSADKLKKLLETRP